MIKVERNNLLFTILFYSSCEIFLELFVGRVTVSIDKTKPRRVRLESILVPIKNLATVRLWIQIRVRVPLSTSAVKYNLYESHDVNFANVLSAFVDVIHA